MSTSKAAAPTQPMYILPNAIHKEIPKRWAKNMETLTAVMREIPDEAAEEDVAWEWMEKYEVVSDQIEQLCKFTANMSAEVPKYPEDTKEVIGPAFMMMVALHNQFPQCVAKLKGKTAQPLSSSTPVDSDGRCSQWQLEKAAMVEEGSKVTTHATDSVAVKEVVSTPCVVPVALQETVAVVDNQTKVPQGANDPCKWCFKLLKYNL
ncbi:hypothetical protein PISMIDRAFT_18827 [Pisolithus microcarpus 441]|uniref:Uncharacterized protein n=1 Tax=Pisolithus microcarpus 441 TaxID=765257 RepID=A0A0C9YPK8_9AGAM|nr:hypothetical protein PISMIDRAFT_18827 [Pisolithus microcarpus 441]